MTEPWKKDWGKTSPPLTQLSNPWQKDWSGGEVDVSPPLEGGGNLFKFTDDQGKKVAARANSLEEARARHKNFDYTKQKAIDDEQNKRLEPHIRRGGNALYSAALGAAQGLTFNHAAPILGGIMTAPTVAKAAVPFTGTRFSDIPENYKNNSDFLRDEIKEAKKYGPKSYIAGDLVGSVIGAGKVLKGVQQIPKIGKYATSLVNTAANGGIKGLGAASAIGAGLGAASSHGEGEDMLTGAAMGAAGGAAGNALANKIIVPFASKAAGLFSKKPQIPSMDQLKSKAASLYDQADNAGVIFTPQGLKNLSKNVLNDLADFGYHPKLQPRISAAIDEIERLSDGNVTLKGMEQLRKIANNSAISLDPSERKIAGKVIRNIDNFVENAKDREVLLGDNAVASNMLKDARGMWQQVKKAEEISDMVERAGYRAGSSGSGGNVDNATRQNLRRMLEKGKGLTSDEQQALKNVVLGTPIQNALRLTGKLSPQGVISTALSVGAGTALAGPIGGVALPAIGYAAKQTANKMTQANTKRLLDIILAGGDKASVQKVPNALQNILRRKSSNIGYNSSILGALTGAKLAKDRKAN